MPETMRNYKIHISRFNPETDDRPVLREYEVPPIYLGTVLEALQYIQEEIDSTLLFSYGCRYKVCGKCAIKINGEPRLACETPLQQGIVLEPLDNLPVIRDLAVDRSGLMDPLKRKDILLSPAKESEIAVQPQEFFQLTRCIECLSCLSSCPVFALGNGYEGPFFGVKLAELYYDVRDEKDRLDKLKSFYDCTACQACTTSCPIQLDMDELANGVRRRLSKGGIIPKPLLDMRDNILNRGNIYASRREERIEIYPSVLRERARKGELKAKAETLLFMGCVPSYLDMKIVPSLLKPLDAAGVDYTTLSVDEGCCGFPLYLMGSDYFEPHARDLIERIRSTGANELVTPCAGCYKTFRKIYPKIEDLGMVVYHSVHYLERLINEGKIRFEKDLRKKVTYHDPCDLGRTFRFFEEPRNILKEIPGLQYVEMARNRLHARCCGGGGGVQAHDPDMAVDMARKRVRDALAVGAEIIVSGCVACKDNLRKGAKAIPKNERNNIKIMDITEIVAYSMKE